MKNTIIKFGIWFCIVLLTTGCNAQEPEPIKTEPVQYITSFDVKKLMGIYFPDYVHFDGSTNYSSKGYRFNNKDKNIERKGDMIVVSIAILPSKDESYRNVDEMIILNEVSSKYELVEDMPGDHFWGTYNGNTLFNTSCIITIDNIMITLYKQFPGIDMIEFARSIERDVRNKTCEYFTISDKIDLPVIKTVISERNSMKIGEETLITIDATDTNGGNLGYYFTDYNIVKNKEGKANEYIFKPSKYSQFHDGKYTFKVRAINENNVYSKAYEFSIKSDD